MAAERSVLLHRGSDSVGLGFSLLGTPHLPPIIYDILENSPAAESGEVEAGDVILKINETDVNRFTTKEVLKCLRLSGDPVRLQLKRDPKIKQQVIHLLQDMAQAPTAGCDVAGVKQPADSVDSEDPFPLDDNLQRFSNKSKQPRFEAFMMTGDLILNLSRNQQTTGILPKHQKKIDSLRSHRHRTGNVNSVPTSPSEEDMGVRRVESENSGLGDDTPTATGYSFQTGVRTSKSEDHLQLQKDSSLAAVDIEIDEDVTSSLNTLLDTRLDSSCGSLSYRENATSTLSDQSSNVTVLQITEEGQWTNQTVKSNGQTDATNGQTDSPLREKRREKSEQRHSGHYDKEHRHSGHYEKEHRHSGHYEKGEHRRSGHYDKEHNHRHSGHYDGNKEGRHSQHLAKHSGSSSDLSTPSPGHSGSPPSPTSLSSSILPSDPSASNISSPDYHEGMTLDMLSAIEMTDPSDSDSTILVSERGKHSSRDTSRETSRDDGRIICYVEPPDPPRTNGCGSEEVVDVAPSPPPLSQGSTEDDSDVESIESFHYSPKAVDIPSAVRLAKRLFYLDGFKKSDVSRQLSKNNDFSRAVAEEYLKYFSFEGDTLDVALRKFLKQFALTGETQERERVLVHFSKRYLDCNPRSYNSTDAVHTLTCALMLLNTDLHSQNLNRKMTCEEFIQNLSELNDGENFPREGLKALYKAIVYYPVEWALDDDSDLLNGPELVPASEKEDMLIVNTNTSNPFLALPDPNAPAIEYKKGYVMRKCCLDLNGKRTPFGKRGWKMLYCTLRDMVLYLHKDEHGFRKSQLTDSIHNAIRIHHSLATPAEDYTKKQYVFRLETADRAEFLFQTSDSKELQSWIETINFVAALYSSQPLSCAVSSSDKFQRPLLPSSRTKLSMREQLADHIERTNRLERELEEYRKYQLERGTKSLSVPSIKEKYAYLQYEFKRYSMYSRILRSRVQTYNEASESNENISGIIPPPVPDRIFNGVLMKNNAER